MNIRSKVNKYFTFTIFSLVFLIIFISSYTITSKLLSNFLINEILFLNPLPTAFGDQDQVEFSKKQAIEKFKSQFCGINSKPNSNQYVQEIKLNNECEMPLAIIYDDSVKGLWYISTKHGSLILYQPDRQVFT